MAWAIPWGLMPFSGVFYPPETLPMWGQKVSALLPTTYIFEGMREVITTGLVSYEKLFISFGLNILYLIIAVVFFKICFSVSLKKGLSRLEY